MPAVREVALSTAPRPERRLLEQVLAGPQFLCRDILRREIGWVANVMRARRRAVERARWITREYLMPVHLLLAASALAAAAVVGEPEKPLPPRPTRPNLTFEQLAVKLRPSVVVVLCMGGDSAPILGTGFVVDPNGLVATNAHVVTSCSQILVKQAASKPDLSAVVLRRNADRDVAILRVSSLAAPALALGSTDDVAPGTPILAVGHPQGLEYTVSDGIVSAIRELGPNWKIVQMTAPISPGSSGGPVANGTGRVIGMSTLYLERGQNLNFAVAAEDVSRLLDEAKRDPTPLPLDRLEPNEAATSPTAQEVALADLARVARKAKRYEDAAKILRVALDKHPESLRLRLELAEVSWDKEDFSAAEKYTMEMLVRDPSYPPAHQCLSALHVRAGRWQDAKIEAQKAIDLGADDEYCAYAHSILAAVALHAGDNNAALVHLDEASRYPEIALEPKYHAQRAALLLLLGRTQEANQASEKALSLAPEDEALRSFLREIGLPRRVVVLSKDSQWNILGNLVVKGVVRNVSDRPVSFARVVAESLDSAGTVVGTGSAYVEPTTLLPGMTGSFEIYVEGNPEKGSHYRVLVIAD